MESKCKKALPFLLQPVRELDLHTTLPGEVQVNQDRRARIVPRYPGLVIEVRKTIGDRVEKGDVLAVLEGNESLAPYDLKSLIAGTIIEKHISLGESLKDGEVVSTIEDAIRIKTGKRGKTEI